MDEPTYPYGYGSTRKTIDDYDELDTVEGLHPECWRRFRTMMIHAGEQGVDLGVGDAMRIQPDPPPPGFAAPGNSWHETCDPSDPSSGGAMAIDTVPAESWDFMEVRLAEYGLRSFRHVNNEPWHIQPVELPASRDYHVGWIDLPYFQLPGDEEEDMPLTDEEIDRIAEAAAQKVWSTLIDTTTGDKGDRETARFLLDRTFNTVGRIERKLD